MRLLITVACLSLLLFYGCTLKSPVTAQQPRIYAVMDSANLLTPKQEDSIATVIQALELDVGSQIAVLTLHSLNGQGIEEFSLRTANELALGRAAHNDGVLITVSYSDRMARIEVGKGLERIIIDDLAAQWIREDMAPKFRENKFGEGLYIVVEKISNMIREHRNQIGK